MPNIDKRNNPAWDPNDIQARLMQAFPDLVPLRDEYEEQDLAEWEDLMIRLNELRHVA